MMANDSFTAKWSDKRMEGDGGLRTVECLRGRLLSERAASKAANDESEQIGKKLIELEEQLKMEIKLRNKAEKRLKYLMKKLDSLNIPYVSADESSSLSEKSEISSVSSSSKSQHQMELLKAQFSKCVTDTDTSGERHKCPSQSHDDNLDWSLDEAICENSNKNATKSIQEDGEEDDLQGEDNDGSKSSVTKIDTRNEEDNQDSYCNVDNSMALVMVEEQIITTPRNDEDLDGTFDKSMALVVVDCMVKEEKQDVPISNGNVKDVLDALRYARESLQTSLEMRRHMKSNINVGARLDDRISC